MSTTFTQVTLRGGGIDDLAIVEPIMQAAFDPRYGEAWTRSQCAGVMAMPGVALTIAELDGRPAGFAITRTIMDEAELLLLAVDPARRRRGIGRALLRAAIADGEAKHIAKIHLEVRSNNGAIALYQQAGFVKIGERRDYYRGNNGKLFDAHTFMRMLR
ncbi:ribosomal protein S18-alanine N-acetyltransferase [Hephaestia sp. GCM10023244]|uniref:ribosomal protein S18-alanine N-acetyltransferase n=1 Tax=unclassified Hephaestia TaxID=2631281 RepID=UPI002077406C|nr:ribosomal protein S18-alanine N-acetyltransferase [Hephaestia sp. MAHUQ-44]MCM8731925.1 ribosomal protein S18-alanine N-acetyltransferase [Hephaestia sp. MAHUQ-44]